MFMKCKILDTQGLLKIFLLLFLIMCVGGSLQFSSFPASQVLLRRDQLCSERQFCSGLNYCLDRGQNQNCSPRAGVRTVMTSPTWVLKWSLFFSPGPFLQP